MRSPMRPFWVLIVFLNRPLTMTAPRKTKLITTRYWSWSTWNPSKNRMTLPGKMAERSSSQTRKGMVLLSLNALPWMPLLMTDFGTVSDMK